MSRIQRFRLPDLIKDCAPLEDGLNPHYADVAPEAHIWISGFLLFPTAKEDAYFSRCRFELLASHTYPYAGPEQYRLACDLINILFAIDDLTDKQSAKEASNTFNCFLQAIRNPTWDDNNGIAKVTKDFRIRLGRLAGPNNLRRFIKVCEDWAEGTIREITLRETGAGVLTADEYIPLRRYTSANMLTMQLAECCLGIDLPDYVYDNPVLLKAYYAVCHHVSWANDVMSYHVEEAKGHTTNFVAVAMKDYNLSLREAYDYVGSRCRQCVNDYVSARDEYRATFGQGDVLRYIEALGCWIIGNAVWSFETPRYLGHKRDEIRRNLILALELGKVPKGADSDVESDSDY